MKLTDIVPTVKRCERDWKGDNHNYRSWELCYRFFRDKPRDRNLACLHLTAYLASFGMYRGSAFIASKDYLVHEAAIKAVARYFDRLRNLDLSGCLERIDDIFSLGEELRSAYMNLSDDRATDTLVSKIMMGTLGCVPAYDEYFRKGLKEHALPRAFSRKSYNKLLRSFCEKEIIKFEEARRHLSQRPRKFDYPVMRVVDIYFWQRGYEVEEARKKQRLIPPSPPATS